MEKDVVLSMRGISMYFPGVKALDNVDFNLKKGEIRALMGENGGGKSTLIKCLTGVNKFDFPVVMGSLLYVSIVLIIINILCDIIYGWLDPRVSLN